MIRLYSGYRSPAIDMRLLFDFRHFLNPGQPQATFRRTRNALLLQRSVIHPDSVSMLLQCRVLQFRALVSSFDQLHAQF